MIDKIQINKDFRGVATEIKHTPPDRSLTSRDLEDLRRWAVLMAIDAHKHDVVPVKDIVSLAVELEHYVLNGAPPKSGVQTLGQPGMQTGSVLGRGLQPGETWR